MQHVYGNGSSKFRAGKYDVDLLYRNTPVQVMTHEWGHKRPLSKLPATWGDTYFHHSGKSYQDNEWAEVTRYSTYFLNSYKETEEVWEEGLSRGFPGRSKYNSTKVAYGCWFYLAQGSGIFVNVGRTLVVSDKYKSTLFQELGLTPRGCLPTDGTGRSCYDRYICTAALAQGYDSVQVTGRSELVICGGKCATQSLQYTCPPLELRSGIDASRACNCSDESHLLNCGNQPDSVPNLKWNFPANGSADASNAVAKRHTLCMSRNPPEVSVAPFDITIAFTSGALQGTVPYKALRSARDTLRDKSAVLLDVGGVYEEELVAKGSNSRQPESIAAEDAANISEKNKPGYLRGTAGANESSVATSIKRLLQATPLGPFLHTSLIPPPVGSWWDTRWDQPVDRNPRRQHANRYYNDDQEGRHHRPRRADHPGQNALPHIPTPAELVVGALRTAISSSGYVAVVGDPRAENVTAGLSVPLLYPASVRSELQTVLNVGDVKVGLLVYAERQRDGDAPAHLRKHIDEAVCLRNAGASVVIMMSATARPLELAFLQGLKGYVDVVTSAVPASARSPQSCSGMWHTAAAGEPVEVQITSNSNMLGAVRIVRDKQAQFSVSSTIHKI
jgi:hypothetical protein